MKIKNQEKVRMQYLAGIISESAMQEEKNRLYADLKTVNTSAEKKLDTIIAQYGTVAKALANIQKIDLDGLFTVVLKSTNIDLNEPGMLSKLNASLKKSFDTLTGGTPTDQPTSSEPSPEEPTNL
jgi:hypothetical protein